MSRAHDERKELREGVLSSSGSRVMNPGMPASSLDKEKHEMQSFGNESTYGHRTLDLINKQHSSSLSGRSLVGSIGSVGQYPPMPPLQASMLLPGGPPLISPSALPHAPILRGGALPGQHPFPSHIPTGIVAAAAAVAPPRAAPGPPLRTSIPPLKQSQVQLPISQLSGKQPNMFSPVITSNRSQPSTISSLHSHSSDHRTGEPRISHMPDPHHSRSGTATIQVIASGTASLPPHSNHGNKNMSMNTSQNVLKIGSPSIQQSVYSQATHSSSSTTPVTTVATVKFAGPQNNITIGKLYSAPSIIIPSTSSGPSGSRNEHPPNIKVPDHRINMGSTGSHVHHSSPLSSSHHSSYSSHSGNPSHSSHGNTGSPSDSKSDRSHQSNQLSYTIGPCFMDSGFSPVIGMHPFPHNFHIRPPLSGPSTLGSLPAMFTVDSTRGFHPGPLAFGHFSSNAKGIPSSDAHVHSSSSDATHISSAFTIQSLYPNLQPSSHAGQVPVTTSNAASPRPSILRKRTLEGYPAHSDRMTSPTKSEPKSDANISAPHSRQNSPKPTSENSSETRKSTPPIRDTSSQPNSNTTPTITEVKREVDPQPAPSTVTTSHLPNSVHTSLIASPSVSNSNTEASPRKKPRKQHVVTTEDKYSSTVSIDPYAPDKNLKPTIKDCTKESPLAKLSSILPPLDLNVKPETTTKEPAESDDALKYYLFRRRPRVSIVGDYKPNTKAAHNHFYRLSDIRPKEEKKMSVTEIVNQKKFLQSISGWKLYHISSQLDDLSSLEEDVCQKMCDFQKKLPRPSKQYMSSVVNHGAKKSSVDEQLRVLHELIQGNIQRCQLSVEQLREAKRTMLKVLDYKPKALEVMKKHKHKRTSKKKNSSS